MVRLTRIAALVALAFALASCMAVDVVMILTKGRHELHRLDVQFTGSRAEGPPSYFTDVTLHYELVGSAPEEAVRRAIALSRDKYCSVWHSLREDIELTSTFDVTPPAPSSVEGPESSDAKG